MHLLTESFLAQGLRYLADALRLASYCNWQPGEEENRRKRSKPTVDLAQIQVRYMYSAIIVTSSLLIMSQPEARTRSTVLGKTKPRFVGTRVIHPCSRGVKRVQRSQSYVIYAGESESEADNGDASSWVDFNITLALFILVPEMKGFRSSFSLIGGANTVRSPRRHVGISRTGLLSC